MRPRSLGSRSMRPAAVHHHGAVVALSDAIQCPDASPDGWACSLLPNHEGDHVAYCFDERTGLPEKEPMAVWNKDDAPEGPSDG